MKNRLLSLVLGVAGSLLALPVAAQQVDRINLPAALAYPEGIAYDADAGVIFNASAIDGVVVRTNLATKKSEVIFRAGALLPAGTPFPGGLIGMKLDGAKRLWLVGGCTGKVVILDSHTGKLIKAITLPGKGWLLNDIILTPDSAYITDSFQPILWRIPFMSGTIGEAQAWIDLNKSPIRHAEGANLNGIAKSPDNKTLLVVQMNKGLLFKIDVASKTITPVAVSGGAITGTDGLELDGNTLYLARHTDNEVVTMTMAPGLGSGKIRARWKDPALQAPATAVKIGDKLAVVSTQMDKREAKNPVLPFFIAMVPLSLLK